MDFKELLTYLKGSFDASIIITFAVIAFILKLLKTVFIYLYKGIVIGKDYHEKIQDVEPMKKDIEEMKSDVKDIKEELRQNKIRDEKTHELLTTYKKEKHDAEGQRDLLIQSLQQLIKPKNENS